MDGHFTHTITQNKWGKEIDVPKEKKKKHMRKKRDEHTKERAEKWMRSNRKRQKIKEEIDKSRKKIKVLLVEIFIQNTWDFFFPIFSLIWGDCILVGTRRKYSCPTSFPSHFLLQIKTPKYHSLLPFPSLQNHPN